LECNLAFFPETIRPADYNKPYLENQVMFIFYFVDCATAEFSDLISICLTETFYKEQINLT